MDNGYVGADPMILKAITPSHSTPCPENLSSLVRLPSLGSTSPLPGLHDAASRVKCEDRAGIFSRAAAHLICERTAKCPESSFGSPPTCDLHSCQAVYYLSSSTVPMFATTDVVSSSCNTLNYRGSSIYKLPYLAHVPVANLTTEELYEPEGDYHVLVSPARFSELMLHVLETSEASSSRLMSSSSSPPTISSTPPTTSTVDKNSSLTEGITSSPMYSKLSTVQANVLGGTPLHAPDSPNSPSKQDSSVMSAEDSDADHKIQSNIITKRRNCGLRKTQPKKVVCIPSGESKQKGSEAPRSDTWAWRKYGQKPIKGSPFPRGYYRCSSSKGCPARKQVERSRSDPNMVMVTYTADHNHTWPASRSLNSSKAGPSRDKSQDMEDTRSYQKVENLFSSIINSPSAVDEQVISSMDSLQEEESFALQRDVDLCLSRTSCTEGDDVFDNLGELPELSAIFSKGYG